MSDYGNIKIGYIDHKVIGSEFDSFVDIMKNWSSGQEITDNHIAFYHVRLSVEIYKAIDDLSKKIDFLTLSRCDESDGYRFISHYVSSNGDWFEICKELNMGVSKREPDGTEKSVKDVVDEFYSETNCANTMDEKTIKELEIMRLKKIENDKLNTNQDELF